MNNVNPLTGLYDKFYELSRRERGLLIVAGLVLILMGGYTGVVEPIERETQRLASADTAFDIEMARLDKQVADLQQALGIDPDADTKQQMANLEARIVEIDDILANQTLDLVPAHRMPTLLENVMADTGNVSLLSMYSIPPQALLASERESKNEQTQNSGLYQHGVRLELEGRYFDIQRYLQNIEGLPWRFYWKLFQYEVTDYPIAKVQIELYTLSTSQAFIGVADGK